MPSLICVNRIFHKAQIKAHLKNVCTIVAWSRNYSTKNVIDITKNVDDNQKLKSGPINILQLKCESGELKEDEHQRKVMIDLQTLYDTIQSYSPSQVQSKSSFFKWLPTKSQHTQNKAPKGLYIYGSVGGGKTTLMDLFFNSCDEVWFTWNLNLFSIIN